MKFPNASRNTLNMHVKAYCYRKCSNTFMNYRSYSTATIPSFSFTFSDNPFFGLSFSLSPSPCSSYSAVVFSEPNPKRAERYSHYHSCSRQRKVCLDPILFRQPGSTSTPALVRARSDVEMEVAAG